MSEATNTQHYRTTNPYEELFGYSRAVRKGPFIFISGTTSTLTPPAPPLSSRTSVHTLPSTPAVILHPDSAYNQATHIFRTIISSVESLGGKRTDIMRVRMFVRDEQDCEEVGRALKESLGEDVLPAATMIVGAGFVNPDMKVEIEADAVVLD